LQKIWFFYFDIIEEISQREMFNMVVERNFQGILQQGESLGLIYHCAWDFEGESGWAPIAHIADWLI